MRENFLKLMRFALSDASLFSVDDGHLSLIPLPNPPSLTHKSACPNTHSTHLPERHPPALTHKSARLNTHSTHSPEHHPPYLLFII
jgi:hypothetical protein